MKLLVLLFLALITTIQVKSQDDVEIMVHLLPQDKIEWKITKDKLYFDEPCIVDSSVFSLDTLVFCKDNSKSKSAILVLSYNSTFHLYYNIENKQIRKTNFETGEAEILVVRKQDAMHGTWKSSDNFETVSLVQKNNSKTKYKIVEKNAKLWFIKL